MTKPLSAAASMNSIGAFIQTVVATEKRAAANTEPGSIGGETSHPVKDVDDGTEDAKEGARSAENTADVKADQGKPSVESTPEATSEGTKKASLDLTKFAKGKQADDGKSAGGAVQTPGSAADDQLQIGTNVQPTGEDSSTETSSAKAGKEDPGSKHEARTDNDALDGNKYSADRLAQLPLEELAKMASDLGDAICRELNDPRVFESKPQAKQASDEDVKLAHQAGWELAGLFAGNMDKKAVDAEVQRTLEEIIKTASDDAVAVADYLDGLREGELRKQAEAGGPPPDPSQGGGLPPGMAGPGPGEGGGDEELLAALGGGGAPPAGLPEGVGSELSGPGGEEGGEGGGEVSDEALQLAQLLEELGVTPEELEQAMAQSGGDAAGAPPPPAGGEGGGAGEESMGPGLEHQAADKGKKATKTAATKNGHVLADMKSYIQETLARSRAKR